MVQHRLSKKGRATAIISIKPEYATLIKTGAKQVEFRKSDLRFLNKIIFYETRPVQACTCETTVLSSIRDKPGIVWNECEDIAGIDQKTFNEYVGRKQAVTALFLGEVTVYDEPKPLSEFGLNSHPQNFVYLHSYQGVEP